MATVAAYSTNPSNQGGTLLQGNCWAKEHEASKRKEARTLGSERKSRLGKGVIWKAKEEML